MRVALDLAVVLGLGICLGWAGAYATGHVVVFAAEHQLFGLPVFVATVIEIFIAWVPLGFAAGVLLKRLLGRKALAASLSTAAASLLTVASIGQLGATIEYAKWFASLTYVLVLPGLFVLAAVPLGAAAAKTRRERAGEA